MIDKLHDAHQRFGNIRPGLIAIALLKVAIPTTTLRLVVNAQQKKEIPLLDEVVLRAIEAGLVSPQTIALLTGLEERLVSETVAALAVEGYLSFGGKSDLRLTPRGRVLAEELTLITPTVESADLSFDRMTWKLVNYRTNRLLNKRDCASEGVTLCKAIRTKEISREDVTIHDFRSLLSLLKTRNPIDYLRIVDLSTRAHKYYTAEIIIYTDSAGETVECAFLVDDDRSSLHEIAFIETGGLAALNFSVGETEVLSATVPDATIINELSGIEYASKLYELLQQSKDRITFSLKELTSSRAIMQALNLVQEPLKRGIQLLLVADGDPTTPLDRNLADLVRQLTNIGDVRIVKLNPEKHGTLSIKFDQVFIDNICLPWIADALDYHPPEDANIPLRRVQVMSSPSAHAHIQAELSRLE